MLKITPPCSTIGIECESIDLCSLEVREEVDRVLNDKVHAFFESVFSVGKM